METPPGVEDFLLHFTQAIYTGGVHTSPDARALLLFLARSIDAQRIIETGYDAGYTTAALAASGAAEVIGIDNLSEHPEAAEVALRVIDGYPNIKLLFPREALHFLIEQPDDSICMLFIDDSHNLEHVRAEAIVAKRIVRPGGIIAFHDVRQLGIWRILVEVFEGWEMMNLPAISPNNGVDYGIGIVRRPD